MHAFVRALLTQEIMRSNDAQWQFRGITLTGAIDSSVDTLLSGVYWARGEWHGEKHQLAEWGLGRPHVHIAPNTLNKGAWRRAAIGYGTLINSDTHCFLHCLQSGVELHLTLRTHASGTFVSVHRCVIHDVGSRLDFTGSVRRFGF